MHLILLVMLAFYFLPSILAWNKKDAAAIIAINIFLGWTFIGWIVALIWAITSGPAVTYVVVNQQAAPQTAPPAAAPTNAQAAAQTSPAQFCTACGKYSPPGGTFCSTCGRRMA